jgi:N-acetylmuramoyl-L-alanine amidase
MKNVKSGHSRPIVCLDAGHYAKYNRSPAVKDYYESDMTWKLHLLLKKELESYGIQVTQTRANKDIDMGLKSRGKASSGADLFLSLHSNATGSGVNESVDYVAVYHLYEDAGTDVDDKSKALAKLIAPVIADTMNVKQGSRVLSRKGSGDWNGDGVLNDNYYGVLNGARLVGTPGLILEHSFHTNTRATKWLLEEANLRKLAKAEAKVIADYFDLTYHQSTAESENESKGVCTVNLKVLKKGSKGDAVKALQALLIGYGYELKNNGKTYGVDGSFGGATENAVLAYQKKNGLQTDGSVGPKTWAKLLGVQ